MKQYLFLFLVFTISIDTYSQIGYEQGYFIDSIGNKTTCLIKNIDWKNNPEYFEYKRSEDSNIQTATIEMVQEFGVDNFSKYIRATVQIDKSSESVNTLSKNRNPLFEEETIFLKALVEGDASLYEYVNSNLRRYFYRLKTGNIEPLIFKRFKTDDNLVGENNRYRQQLWNDVKCPDLKMSKIENLNYTKNELTKYFLAYSLCQDQEPTYVIPKNQNKLIHLTLRPRLNRTSLSVNNYNSIPNVDFGTKNNFAFGVELEFISNFNKNKWGFAIEPTYQSFNSEVTQDVSNVSGGKLISIVSYSSIELPFTLRHYFFLNEKSKIFINASAIYDIQFSPSIQYNRANGSSLRNEEFVATSINFGFGIGYKYNDKFGLELRKQTLRNIVLSTVDGNTDYQTLSLILGYSIF